MCRSDKTQINTSFSKFRSKYANSDKYSCDQPRLYCMGVSRASSGRLKQSPALLLSGSRSWLFGKAWPFCSSHPAASPTSRSAHTWRLPPRCEEPAAHLDVSQRASQHAQVGRLLLLDVGDVLLQRLEALLQVFSSGRRRTQRRGVRQHVHVTQLIFQW